MKKKNTISWFEEEPKENIKPAFGAVVTGKLDLIKILRRELSYINEEPQNTQPVSWFKN